MSHNNGTMKPQYKRPTPLQYAAIVNWMTSHADAVLATTDLNVAKAMAAELGFEVKESTVEGMRRHLNMAKRRKTLKPEDVNAAVAAVHAHVATLALDVVRLANEIGASLDNISGTTLRMAREEQARQHTAEREAHQQELEHNW